MDGMGKTANWRLLPRAMASMRRFGSVLSGLVWPRLEDKCCTTVNSGRRQMHGSLDEAGCAFASYVILHY